MNVLVDQVLHLLSLTYTILTCEWFISKKYFYRKLSGKDGLWYNRIMDCKDFPGRADAHPVRAVMEGVTYALRDSLEILEEMGIHSQRILASGGACSSPVWLQIQADILGKEVQVCKTKEQACLGACILAGVGTGIYTSIKEACDQLVEFEERVYVPREEVRGIYEEGYRRFHGIYEGSKGYL